MRKLKILAFITSILTLTVLSQTPVFAAETGDLPNVSDIGTATFEAESPEAADVAELKQTLASLQTELTSMKSGMQDLQAKFVEAEIEKLQAQLATIRGGTSTQTNVNPTIDLSGLYTTGTNSGSLNAGEPNTPEVTKIEDFVGFELDGSTKAEIAKDDTVENKATSEDTTDLSSALESADAEIARLEAILADKEALAADEAAHAEVKAKVEQLKATRAKLEEVAVEEAVDQLRGAEETEPAANIIAKADDSEVLFQFPRTVSQKTGSPKQQSLSAQSLTADILDVPPSTESNFKRSSPAQKNWDFLSGTSLSIFGSVIAVVIAIFVTWLIRNERQMLAATSRRFQQLELKPNFDLNSHAKKLATKNGSRGTNIIQ